MPESVYDEIVNSMKIFAQYYRYVLLGLLLFTLTTTVNATDFLVDYDVDYSVKENGVTGVTQNVSLVNKKTNLYAQQYGITIDSTQVQNVRAWDRIGTIIPQIKEENGKTQILLAFNDEVVGLGKILKFTLTYEDANIAKKNGTIWEINIPGIAEDQELSSYDVQLTTPSSFGQPAFLVPQPQKEKTWTKEQLVNGGINAAFGDKQVFDLNLSYFLENPQNQAVITEISLPPSTSYQRILLESIEPAPIEIVPDDDHNWLARYRLPPQSTLTITAHVFAEIYVQPRQVVYPLPDKLKQTYLQSTEFWPSNNQTFQALATTYNTPESIYTYVIDTLNYDYEKVNQQITRKGAENALLYPTEAVCMEFTDVFITMARAAGIPARQAVGYAYTTNPKLRPLSLVTDVLHAWPEYYDATRQRWIPVDPTWGDTTGGIDYYNKLDFNHIVFAYNGIRDTYPYPAGFYRQTGKVGRDIEVRFSEEPLKVSPTQLNVYFDTPQTVTAGLPGKGNITVKNAANVAVEEVQFSVTSHFFNIEQSTQATIVPPFGTLTIPVQLNVTNVFQTGKAQLTATVNGYIYRNEVSIRPAYFVIAPILIISLWLTITIIIILHRILKQRKHS